MNSNLGNKEIFSKNLKKYILSTNKERKEICNDLGFKYSTFSEWISGKKYPRIDKIEMLANYFGIMKSDLIEEKQNNNNNIELISQEVDFIKCFRKLTDTGKEKVIDYTEMVYNSEQKDNN